MSYVDLAVYAVPKANKEAYRKQAEEMAKIFKELGALSVSECWGDEVPEGKVTSFPLAVQCSKDEVVCLSRIVWPSKQARNEAMPKAMKKCQPHMKAELFDSKRMIHGGFEMILDV